jgi:hypothetical protein
MRILSKAQIAQRRYKKCLYIYMQKNNIMNGLTTYFRYFETFSTEIEKI